MKVPFVKAHGARNDFLLTWAHLAPAEVLLEKVAMGLCDRTAGVGADGWLLVYPPVDGKPPRIRLFNPDGGEVEISGNGTRCAAAFLCDAGLAQEDLTIETGAGSKQLKLLERRGLRFQFEMGMGVPRVLSLREPLTLRGGVREATTMDVGNPQCAFFVESFDFDWKSLGAEVEVHPHFPQRTNVSFVHVLERHCLDVRFFERGAGFTMSSGTGSTGAVAAALARGLVESPVTVNTLAGPLHFRSEGDSLVMQGPSEIVAAGEYYIEG
jgi:diaminopimelate epimerase